MKFSRVSVGGLRSQLSELIVVANAEDQVRTRMVRIKKKKSLNIKLNLPKADLIKSRPSKL